MQAHDQSQRAPLSGRRALVTGGTAGIGRAIASRFAADGADVVAFDLKAGPEPAAAGVRVVTGDVTDPVSVTEAVRLAGGGEGLDICVANAGVALMQPFVEGDLSTWDRVMQVNLLGVMSTLQAAAQTMVGTGRGGRLLVTASIAGLHGERGGAAYCASKAAVIGLVKTLALELGEDGITVNAVAPGQIDTEMNARDLEIVSGWVGRSAAELRREHLDERVPARRLGSPEEVAAAFAFLASDEARFVTGEVLRVDGGELAA